MRLNSAPFEIYLIARPEKAKFRACDQAWLIVTATFFEEPLSLASVAELLVELATIALRFGVECGVRQLFKTNPGDRRALPLTEF